MSKLTLSNLSSLQNENTALSTLAANNARVIAALDNTLSLDGAVPSAMEAVLDMNSHRIINLPTPVEASDPIRKEDLDEAIALSDALGYAFSVINTSASVNIFEVFATATINGLTLTSSTPRIRLTYPHGSMILKRQASAPAHKAYVQSADGAYYVWESGVLVPELVGADSTPGVDNTQQFIDFGVAITALKPKEIALAHNVVYDILPDDPAIRPCNISITGASNWTMHCNGASFRATYSTTTASNSFIVIVRCKSWKILDFKGAQTKTIPVPYVVDGSEQLNIRWITIIDDCTDWQVLGMHVEGGTGGVFVARTLGSAEAPVQRGRIEGYFKNVFYPTALQSTGYDIDIKIETYNAGRSFICYGCRKVRARISSSPSMCVQDAVISAWASPVLTDGDNVVTEDVELYYSSPGQVGGGGPFIAVQNQPAGGLAGVTNYFSGVRDFKVVMDVDIQNLLGGTTPSAGAVLQSLIKDGSGNIIAGDVSPNFITGTISGSMRFDGLAGSGLYLAPVTFGITTNTYVQVSVRDFFAPSFTGAIFIGKYAKVTLDNVETNGPVTIEAAGPANRYTIINARTSDQADYYNHIPNQV